MEQTYKGQKIYNGIRISFGLSSSKKRFIGKLNTEGKYKDDKLFYICSDEPTFHGGHEALEEKFGYKYAWSFASPLKKIIDYLPNNIKILDLIAKDYEIY